jgi:hypothetical protein
VQARSLQIQPFSAVAIAAHGATPLTGCASRAFEPVEVSSSTIRRGVAASAFSTRAEWAGMTCSVRGVGRAIVRNGRELMDACAERRFARDEVHRDQIDDGRFGRFRV